MAKRVVFTAIVDGETVVKEVRYLARRVKSLEKALEATTVTLNKLSAKHTRLKEKLRRKS